MSLAHRPQLTDMELSRDEMAILDERHAEVAKNLLATLEQMQIDPAKVVFSGYEYDTVSDEDKAGTAKQVLREELRQLAREASQHQMDGDFDLHPALKDQFDSRIKELKDRIAATGGQYYFAEASHFDNSDPALNPINFASISADARIGVYDKSRLKEIDPQADIGGVWVVSGTLDQIEAAKIATIHPRYRDEDGQTINQLD